MFEDTGMTFPIKKEQRYLSENIFNSGVETLFGKEKSDSGRINNLAQPPEV